MNRRELVLLLGAAMTAAARASRAQQKAMPVIGFLGGPTPCAHTALGAESALTAKNATATIAIVFAVGIDPVAAGLVASLARPGGNLTGISRFNLELMPKRLERLGARDGFSAGGSGIRTHGPQPPCGKP
jgi:ABC transporter substrate binding protein